MAILAKLSDKSAEWMLRKKDSKDKKKKKKTPNNSLLLRRELISGYMKMKNQKLRESKSLSSFK